ncbi:MAG: UDP-N-acetyl glucosamine 2-epimerase, partial [Acidobacteria bacterium]|nr:UDP-N-acetyl glucosamine 2-epimerase [Acidobacteriota bacterium]
RIFRALEVVGKSLPILFPAHPRTRKMLEEFGVSTTQEGLRMVEPIGYLDFIHLEKHARLVLTDSGGIQEETTVLGVPCLTLRENTERPVTLTEGSNVLVGNSTERILQEAAKVLEGKGGAKKVPELWDGKASERIVARLRTIGGLA